MSYNYYNNDVRTQLAWRTVHGTRAIQYTCITQLNVHGGLNATMHTAQPAPERPTNTNDENC